MAVRHQSRVLGELTKSSQGNAVSGDRDSMIAVPETFLVTLNVPRPAFKHETAINSAPNSDSFKFSEEILYNATGTQPLAAIGPGLWEIDWSLSQRIAGAVSDLTSTYTLTLAITDGTGASVILAVIQNGQALPQAFSGRMILTVPAPISYEFRRARAGGLGTALNLGLCTIFANKRL